MATVGGGARSPRAQWQTIYEPTSFYVGASMEWPHLMEQSLRAHLVYERDKEYVVQQGKVVIVESKAVAAVRDLPAVSGHGGDPSRCPQGVRT